MTKRGQPDSLALFQRATDRQGVFTLEDARQSGYSQPLVHHYVQAGRFQRIGAGIYRLTEYPRGENDRFAELSALLGPGAILSHESALALYPVSDVAPSKYHFTIPRSKRYVKLARFRGYFPLGGERSTHGQKTYPPLPSGLPAEGRRACSIGSRHT